MFLMDRPITTLFLIASVDGKISSGDSDDLDVDRDWKRIKGVKEGLSQYYGLEQQTDLYSLNSGRVLAKVGINEKTDEPKKLPVSFIVIDNKPHLTAGGIQYLAKKSKNLYIVTSNKNHPAFDLKKSQSNIDILFYENEIDLGDMMGRLKKDHGVDRVTIQTGGTLNAVFIRQGLVDYLSLVVAPLLVGGKTTPTLMDGESLHSQSELFNLKALRLEKCEQLKDSYLHLRYRVLNDTVLD